MERIAVKAARKAGEYLIERFNHLSSLKVKQKSSMDIVTDVDSKAEKIINLVIKKKFPKHHFLEEEEPSDKNRSDYTWVIDPLDGTLNFSKGNPIFTVSIALEYKGEIILSIIYWPTMDELFVAKKGKGATCNNKPIHVSTNNHLGQAVVGISSGLKTQYKINRMNRIIDRIMPKVHCITMLVPSSLSMAYVASGRTDAYINCNSDSYSMAAGALLVTEAGGKITDHLGKKFDINNRELDGLCSNGKLHNQLIKEIKGVLMSAN